MVTSSFSRPDISLGDIWEIVNRPGGTFGSMLVMKSDLLGRIEDRIHYSW
jgi:hypothetical protein